MRIAVIGSGYIGKAAAKYWKNFGHTVYLTTRSTEKLEELKQLTGHALVLDAEGPDRFNPLLKQPLDAILVAVAPAKNEDYRSTYLQTAFDLSRIVHAPGRLQLLYTSSTSVYGDCNGAIVTEETPPRPLNSNTNVLYLTENALLNYSGPEKKVTIFRLGEIYGPGRKLSDRLQQMQGKALPGTGENITNLIHRMDIVTALDMALMGRWQGIYNLCNDLHIPRKKLYEELCQQHGWPSPAWNPAIASVHGGNRIVSNDKLKATGWKPEHQSLSEM